MVLLHMPQLLEGKRLPCRLEVEEHKSPQQGPEFPHMACKIGKRKRWRFQGIDEPCVYLPRQWLQHRRWPCLRVGRGGRDEGLGRECGGALLDLDAVVYRQTLELLSEPVGPADSGSDFPFRLSNSKKHLFGVLGEKTRSRLQVLCLAKIPGFDSDGGSDGIAIALMPTQ